MTTADHAADVLQGKPKKKRLNLAPVQKFGRSLMLPIAALPAAALLLRLGQPDLLGEDGLGWVRVASVIGAAGSALFDNLPILFAVGIAIGMAKKADGSTALAGVVGYLVFKSVGDAMSPFILDAPAKGEEQALIDFGVLGGIVMGLVAAFLWQKYHRIKLPPYLAFFGGRRWVTGSRRTTSSAASSTARSTGCSSPWACTTSSTTRRGSFSAATPPREAPQ